ncbi:MAG: tetratricopeptide repeat protein [Verrucomicrobiota bacterium]
MRSLAGLFLLVFVSVSRAQVQVPEVVESPAQTFQQDQVWTQSGHGLKPDLSEEAIRLLKAAAAANDPDALMKLSAIATSSMDAFEYVRRAAELGNHDAEYELASMYAQGRGVSKDMEKAVLWGRKAAEGGSHMAQHSLGLTLLRDDKNPAARAEGLDWMQKASDAGDSRTALALATIYAVGDFGIPVDESKSEGALKPFAEHDDAECQFALASLYHLGKSYATQRGLAIAWLKRAKENGHPTAGKILAEIEKEKAGPVGK